MSEPTPATTPPAATPAPPARRRRKRLMIWVSLVVFLAGGLAAVFFAGRDTRDDLTKLQGEWKYTRKGLPEGRGPSTVVRINGDMWTFVIDGKDQSFHRIVLNPAADPKEIDLIWVRPDGSPDVFKDQAGKPFEQRQVGIYALSGGTLTVALAPSPAPRPTSFSGENPPSTYTRIRK